MSFGKKTVCFICLFALLCTALISVGISFARYKTSVGEVLIFETKAIEDSGKVYITSEDGWSTSNTALSLNFTLSGGKNADSKRMAYVRLTATEQFDPNATVTLTVDGTTYQAKPHTVSPGELLYSQMGKGTEFRFYNASEEVYWQLSANKNMKLSVQGVSDKSLVRLVAQEK